MRASPATMARLGAVVAVLALSAGCVTMPDEGPVVESPAQEGAEEAPGISFDPRPPQAGDSAVEVVSGFLEAMKAAPIKTSVARQFLTEEAQQSWAPERRILTYADPGDPSGGSRVVVQLGGVNVYDERGAWQVSVPERRLGFDLVREGDEWRISQAPDAVVVPASWFGDWYQRVNTYYFDPTSEILVPEPVFVPRGDQEASALVRSLLATPDDTSTRVLRSHFPEGTGPGLSVPVDAGGLAEVNLAGDPSVIDEETGQRMLAQLVWTLRQLPRVRAVSLRVGDRPLGTFDGESEVGLDVGGDFDPVGPYPTTDLFGLQDRRLVRGDIARLVETQGPLGAEARDVRSVSTNLSGTLAAAVTRDGSALLAAPVGQTTGALVEVVSGRVDLRRPAWDHRDRMWLLDRNAGSARVLLVTGTTVRSVRVPGITGRVVTKLLASRDGTRLVAVRRGGGTDEVVTARVLQERTGRVVGAQSAGVLALPDGVTRIRDLVWRSTSSVSVLSDVGEDLSQVRTVSVDGSPGELVPNSSLRGGVRALVSSPIEGADAYALAGDRIADLDRPDRTVPELPSGLRSLTYAG